MHIIGQLPDEGIGGPAQVVYKGVLLGIPVLVHEAVHAVRHCPSVVLNPKLLLPLPTGPFDEALVLAELALDVG